MPALVALRGVATSATVMLLLCVIKMYRDFGFKVAHASKLPAVSGYVGLNAKDLMIAVPSKRMGLALSSTSSLTLKGCLSV